MEAAIDIGLAKQLECFQMKRMLGKNKTGLTGIAIIQYNHSFALHADVS